MGRESGKVFEQVRVTVVSDEVGNRNVGEVGKLDHDTGRTGGKGGEGAEGILKNQKGTLMTRGRGGASSA